VEFIVVDRRKLFTLAAAIAAAVSAPVLAQSYSEAFSFLKGVRSRDGAAVERILANPSSTALNAREAGTGYGALHILVRARDMTWLSFLLGRGARADIQDNEGNTPLYYAAQIGWSEGVGRLLRAGAAVDMANNRGETPLIAAVQRRDIIVVRQLLARGADPTRTDSAAGYSALDYARRDTRSPEIARILEARRAPARPAAGPTR
jgi:ankyrin repeat protein